MSELLLAALGAAIRASWRGPVEVTRTQNRLRMVSCQRHVGALEVRVASRLLDLGPQIVDPVVAFVTGKRGGRRRLRTVMGLLPAAPPGRPRRLVLRPEGRVHDLARLLDEESHAAFGQPADVPVTWGARRALRRRQRTIRLGSYHAPRGVIRVHPLLDQEDVPAWFVGFVLYHELLHHRLGLEGHGPRRIHSREFRAAERQHPRYEDAVAWERKVLPGLMGRDLATA